MYIYGIYICLYIGSVIYLLHNICVTLGILLY